MEQKEEKAELIPEGKVRTIDGKIIDRAKACFLLEQHPENKEIFRASDNTIYHRSAAGTLRRLNKKKLSKAEGKLKKRQRRNAPTPPNPLFSKEGEPKAGAFEEVA